MVHVKMGNVFKEASFLFFLLLIWREMQHEKSLRAFFFKEFLLSMEGFPWQIPPLQFTVFEKSNCSMN